MVNPIRAYEWGSTTDLARMQGRVPGTRPEAELWMGAHPSDPSLLEQPDGTSVPLDQLIDAHGPELLGPHVHARFGSRLPFLLKVLAIAHPLSVQVHPTAERARTAYEGELGASEHHYVDPFHKPEMVYALEPLDALCGFRSPASARHLLSLFPTERMRLLAAALGDGPAGLEHALRTLVTWPADDRAALAAEVARESRRLLAAAGSHRSGSLRPGDRRALTWASRLAVQHPKDPLVAAPFVLDLVRLEPGQVMFVPAGAPHAYLHGLGVEIMANSDNVLRAGLTHKPIAIDELLTIVDGGSRPVRDVPSTRPSEYEQLWTPLVEEFQLSRITLADGHPVELSDGTGPQVLLCTRGPVTVRCDDHELGIPAGHSAFVGAGAGPLTLAGPGEVFRAGVGAWLTG